MRTVSMAEVRKRVKDLAVKRGVAETARLLGVTREVVCATAAGLTSVRKNTLALILARLEELEAVAR